ncbi:MAG TPA: hypothetical protein VK961_26740 [Chthoniobacter sp.]|nr:hypothetical protein [Chthoniobacter sp.]
MKLLLPAFLLLGLLPLQAQQPPAATPPFQNFPGFPSNFNQQMNGFMGLRSEAPFRALVEKKTVTPLSFTITLKSSTMSRTFTQSGSSGDVLKVIEHLKEGKEYDFPKVFDDVLGKQSANAASSPTLPWSNLPKAPDYSVALLDLPTTAPFRARVVSKKVSKDLVAVELRTTDGRTFTSQETGQLSNQEALRIAGLLKEGELYEFPHDVRSTETAKKSEAAGPSAELKSLEGFIGEWEMPMQTDPSRKLITSYLWKKDGRGIWKEIRAEPNETKRVENASLITYDPARKCYVEAVVRPGVIPRETELRWDPATRTLNLQNTLDIPEPGTVQTGTRRLVSEDRLEWSFRSLTPEGRPVNENSGSYTRVRH